MDLEIVKTDTPQRDLLLLADESEESVADYADRGLAALGQREVPLVRVRLLRNKARALVQLAQ